MNINVKKLHEDAVIPTYATAGSAGFDLYALEATVVDPGETTLIRTGLAFGIPEGYEVQIRPRSGLSLKTKLRVVNAPGTVDQDYIDEVKVIMENTRDIHTERIEKHQRIAQGVLKPVPRATFTEVAEIDETERTGGFGSTGK